MLKNYLVVTFRSFRRNLSFTLINVFGLSVGLCSIIVTFMIFNYEWEFDAKFGNTDEIYRINSIRSIGGNEQQWGVVPFALGPALHNDLTGLSAYCRYKSGNSFTLQYNEDVYRETITFADPNFFETFQYDFIHGNSSGFGDKSSLFITRDLAKKYFGDENPINRILTLRISDEEEFVLKIAGVLDKVPKNSSFQFDLIAPIELLADLRKVEEGDWGSSLQTALYLKYDGDIDQEQLKGQLAKYTMLHNEASEEVEIASMYSSDFAKQKDEARYLHSAETWSGLPISALYGTLVLNTLILLIACFNFVNISIAYAKKRLKEIGVRRTFGSFKTQIVRQFLFENFILCMAALVLAMYFGEQWARLLNAQWPIELEANYFDNPLFLLYLAGMVVLVTILAGVYPAYYVSRFQPVKILKGEIRYTGTNLFTRILLTWQFTFSIMAIFCGAALVLNSRYQQKIDWGFAKDQVVVVPLEGAGSYDVYKNTLLQHAEFEEIGGSVDNIGYSIQDTRIYIDGSEYQAFSYRTSENYLPTMGVEIVEGRDFNPKSEYDQSTSVIVNEEFANTYLSDDPIDEQIELQGNMYRVIGVIRNFMPWGVFQPIKPAILTVEANDRITNLVVRTSADKLQKAHDILVQEWKALFPNLPFDGFYQNESAAYSLQTNAGLTIQFLIQAILALFLSVSGLYANVSLTVNKKTKEIGIRKVLGASIPKLLMLLNRELIVILGIATAIGCATGYLFMDKFLSDIYIYYLSIGASTIILTIMVMYVVAMITAGGKVYRATRINPVDSLRYE